MSKFNLLEEIRCFTALQGAIIEAFHNTYPQVKDLEFMFDAPKNGCVDTGNRLWLFKKHGGGLAFKDWDGVTVDIHTSFGEPKCFDAWRIMQYLDSISSFGENEAEEDTNHDNQQDHRRVEAELLELASSEKLVRWSESLFQLVD